MRDLYVFVDNSNLWIEGKKVSGRQSTPSVPSNHNYRIEYGRLLNHVVGTRTLIDVPRLYGSKPPPNDSVWGMIRAKGFDVQVFNRNIFNKEKGVDMKMGIDITKLTLLTKPPAIVAVVAGDADFVPVVEEARGQGREVEIWYWTNAAGTLKTATTRYIDLNPDVDAIGYEKR